MYGGEVFSINIFEATLPAADNNKVNVSVIEQFNVKKYKMYKDVNRLYSACYTGADLNKLLQNVVQHTFDENVYYLCYVELSARLSIFICDSGKLVYELKKNYQSTLDKAMFGDQVWWHLDCANARILFVVGVSTKWYSHNIYAFYASLSNTKNILINKLQLIGEVYAEGGFFVESILETMNDEYCVWLKMNGKGIGYNNTMYFKLNKSNLAVKSIEEEFGYKYPVDKTMTISI